LESKEKNIMAQKTITSQDVNKLDGLVKEFSDKTEVSVFATHTDMVVFNDVLIHKATLFYKTGLEATTSRPVIPQFNTVSTGNVGVEAGAAWADRRIDGQLNIVWKNGGRTKIQIASLIHDTVKNNWVMKDTQGKEFIFSENKSENPKAPQYRIHYA
jgi:hypothetical protein